MSETRFSHRQVLAAIALADPPAPSDINFCDGRASLGFDQVADLYAWLPYFGMTARDVLTQPYTHRNGPDAGKTSTLVNVYSRGRWYGWRVHLNALDPVDADQLLDEATRAALIEIAAGDEASPEAENTCSDCLELLDTHCDECGECSCACEAGDR